jgi:hypothetical protein
VTTGGQCRVDNAVRDTVHQINIFVATVAELVLNKHRQLEKLWQIYGNGKIAIGIPISAITIMDDLIDKIRAEFPNRYLGCANLDN